MENIHVALRVRPLNAKENQKGEENIWRVHNNKVLSLYDPNDEAYNRRSTSVPKNQLYCFDQCFTDEDSNVEVYHKVVKRVALSSLNGINGTIFMYGQTGSGKTYTMLGYNKNEEMDTEKLVGERVHPQYNMINSKQYQSENASGSSHDNLKYYMTDFTTHPGVLVLALQDIFQQINNDLDKTYFLRCSYIEIYNDQIYDLLKNQDKLGETLTVNEDSRKDFYVKGVTEESVSSIYEILEKLKKGEANRHYARTTMNHASSRSHTIFRLMVQTVTNAFIRDYRRLKRNSGPNINNTELKTHVEETFEIPFQNEGTLVTESYLNFVDLAGSEKVTSHHFYEENSIFAKYSIGFDLNGSESLAKVTPKEQKDNAFSTSTKLKDRVKEGQYINKSLFFLTQVISLKSEGKGSQHIPYRNSPLTKILRSSLGGNSRTLIILCVTPSNTQYDQTLSTLRFGLNAKKIENKVQANIITNNEDEALKILISDYEKKLRDLENNKLEEISKHQGLLRQIEELQYQNKKLSERFNNVCKYQVMKIAETVTDDDLSTFSKEAENNMLFFNQVGLVFNSENLLKYSQKAKNDPNLKNIRIFETEEDEVSNKFIKSLNLAIIRQYKSKVELLQNKIELLMTNIKEGNKRNILNFERANSAKASLNRYKKRMKEIIKKVNQDNQSRVDYKAMCELYKDVKGIDLLDDRQLSEIEADFLRNIDEIKIEKARRVVRTEVNDLKIKLGLSDTPRENETPQPKYVEINIPFSDEDEDQEFFEIENSVMSKPSLQEKIHKEENLFNQICLKGVTEIDTKIQENVWQFNVLNELEEDKLKENIPEKSLNSKDSKRSMTKKINHNSTNSLSPIPKKAKAVAKNGKIPQNNINSKLDFVHSFGQIKADPRLHKSSSIASQSTYKVNRRTKSQESIIEDDSKTYPTLKTEPDVSLDTYQEHILNITQAIKNLKGEEEYYEGPFSTERKRPQSATPQKLSKNPIRKNENSYNLIEKKRMSTSKVSQTTRPARSREGPLAEKNPNTGFNSVTERKKSTSIPKKSVTPTKPSPINRKGSMGYSKEIKETINPNLNALALHNLDKQISVSPIPHRHPIESFRNVEDSSDRDRSSFNDDDINKGGRGINSFPIPIDKFSKDKNKVSILHIEDDHSLDLSSMINISHKNRGSIDQGNMRRKDTEESYLNYNDFPKTEPFDESMTSEQSLTTDAKGRRTRAERNKKKLTELI